MGLNFKFNLILNFWFLAIMTFFSSSACAGGVQL